MRSSSHRSAWAEGGGSICLAIVLSTFLMHGCAESSSGDSAPDEESTSSQQLQSSSSRSPGYTELTPTERAEAETPPWVRNPADHEKPPQKVIDHMKGRTSRIVTAKRGAARRLRDFHDAWAERRADLESRGLTEAEIETRRREFKHEFLTAGGNP